MRIEIEALVTNIFHPPQHPLHLALCHRLLRQRQRDPVQPIAGAEGGFEFGGVDALDAGRVVDVVEGDEEGVLVRFQRDFAGAPSSPFSSSAPALTLSILG